ncbi:MAG: KpsF/GutQ family sugar-phosphate isomerase [Alistipes sp.]|jgi:arabinose-5-phosphate isomerase|uniref:KpsF/GutQ family sugar-phosphate isomerase n=1 Tax=uncultured Alistipes sp. TaxID=538949 RepID=UPI0023C2A6D0|nr:KpsF/GutQ family sugar-phosphate isomerase [uncultured Alistipes sp.]MDE6827406.1 KpsF/GutQ family sugar-phosphate isomerase [Alistipes sp.]
MTDTTKKQILDVARKAIRTEMEALRHLEETLGDEFAAAVELILACRGKCIITGMGKSGLVGRKIAATLASTGTPSFFLHPGEAFHGDLGMISPDDIVVALSYSGETDEILKIVPFIHSNGNKLVSMTGNPESALAKNSDIHLNVGVKEEACILHLAPTTSTTAQIAMGDALAVSLMRMRNFTSVDFARLHPGGSLGRRLLMTVGNVMRSHDLPVVAPDCPAAEMIHAISKGGLGLIVVCRGDRIEGIVTDGDVRRAMESRRAEFFNIVAADIATPAPKSIAASEKLIEAEKMMTRNKVTSLLVTGDDGKLQGVIQIYDIKL